MFAGLCASLAGVASQAGDADSSRAPGLTSGSWTEPGVLACTLTVHSHLKRTLRNVYGVGEPDRKEQLLRSACTSVPSHVTEISLHVT